jgi:Cyclin
METDSGEVIIRVLSNVLTRLIDVNAKSPSGQQLVTKFQSSYPPDVSVYAYLERIKRYARCSDSCFVVALIYIDRLIEMRNVVLTSLNVHRLIITR